MGLNRRDFIKLGGAGTGGLLLFGIVETDKTLGFPAPIALKKKIGERTTVCPYCGVGCSVIMAVENGRITNMEGDPDSPINEGSTDQTQVAARGNVPVERGGLGRSHTRPGFSDQENPGCHLCGEGSGGKYCQSD